MGIDKSYEDTVLFCCDCKHVIECHIYPMIYYSCERVPDDAFVFLLFSFGWGYGFGCASIHIYTDSMAKDFAKEFYSGRAWKKTRLAYWSKAGGLCELCLMRGEVVPGEIVHHKIELTPTNIVNPSISLSFDNLQLVCRECHARLHGINKDNRRYQVDEEGRVITTG